MIPGWLPAARLGFEPSTRRCDSYTVNQMSRRVFAFGKTRGHNAHFVGTPTEMVPRLHPSCHRAGCGRRLSYRIRQTDAEVTADSRDPFRATCQLFQYGSIAGDRPRDDLEVITDALHRARLT